MAQLKNITRLHNIKNTNPIPKALAIDLINTCEILALSLNHLIGKPIAKKT